MKKNNDDEELIRSLVNKDLFARSEEQATRNVSVHVVNTLSKKRRRTPWLKWSAIAVPVAACALIAFVMMNPTSIWQDPGVPVASQGVLAQDMELPTNAIPDTLADAGTTPEMPIEILADLENDWIVSDLADASINEDYSISTISEGDIDALLQDADDYTM